MNISDAIVYILQKLIDKQLNIRYAGLVSTEGIPVWASVGIVQNDALSIAKAVPYLTETTGNELQWTKVKRLYIQGGGHYIVLSFCISDLFLLVHTSETVLGLLDREIDSTIRKLQSIFKSYENSLDLLRELQETQDLTSPNDSKVYSAADSKHLRSKNPAQLSVNTSENSRLLHSWSSKAENDMPLSPDFIDECKQKLAFCIGPIANVVIQQVLSQPTVRTSQQFIAELEKMIPDRHLVQTFREQFASQ